MALVTLRSPSIGASPTTSSNSDGEAEDDEGNKNENRECFFAGKGTALLLSLKDTPIQNSERRLSTDSTRSTNSTQSNNSDIQQHLQSMFDLLRHEATLKMAVKLESQRQNRTRYLVIASRCCYRSSNADRKTKVTRHNSAKVSSSLAAGCTTVTPAPTRQLSIDSYNTSNYKILEQSQNKGLEEVSDAMVSRLNATTSSHSNRQSMKSETEKQNASGDSKGNVNMEESCLLGIDCNERTTIGLVVPILADTTIHLDGDGGFSVSVFGKTHIFKPVSVQAMWSALQTLHKVSQKARENNFYPGGPSHDWCSNYESRIDSEQSCLNEWNAMDSIESRRPPSPDAIRNKPRAKEETETVIKMKLKEIMMSVDLDEVTSKYIRGRLEKQLDMDLGEYKSFIDEEMLMILGQMDAPTEIFEHVYLGSEWNASNLEELQKNGVRHILNVTREIDNFFPGMFDYFNVRVYDDEKTNLLKHWDNTYRYITRAKAEGSKVLVHCKMGVSRSASVVIAYAMKAYNWEFQHALQHVKERRSCIKPNKNFLNQLETYRGMLDAMKNKEKLQRSKSETNLKSTKDARLLPGSEPTPLIQALNQSKSKSTGTGVSEDTGNEVLAVNDAGVTMVLLRKSGGANETKQRRLIRRSSSTSPKAIHSEAAIVLKQQSQSLENLTPERSISDEPKNVRFPGSNGENYSVTQNQVLHIQKHTPVPPPSVRTIIKDLETFGDTRKSIEDRKALNLMFTRSNSQDTTSSQCETESPAPVIALIVSGQSNKSGKSPVWTSSTKLTQTSNLEAVIKSSKVRNPFVGHRDTTCTSITSCDSGDAFSAQLESVFVGEEERRQKRKTHSWAATSGGGVIIEPAHVHDSNIPTKHGSTSSIDSMSSTATTTTSGGGSGNGICNSTTTGANAYDGILRQHKQYRELPSRHASWGSGDNRGSVPTRNSSLGSYDTNRNTFQYGSNATTAAAIFEGQIHELKLSNKTASSKVQLNVGTVKRTKQKLEESTAQKKLCQENSENEMSMVSLSASSSGSTIKRNTNLYRSASAAGSIRSRYPQRCNSEEIVPTTSCSGNIKQRLVRRSDGNRPLLADVFSASAPDSYTISDIENKNIVPPENEESTIDLDHGVLLRALGNQLSKTDDERISGNVQILKKNFEAKAGSGLISGNSCPISTGNSIINSGTHMQTIVNKGHQSLPSSPVAQHIVHSGGETLVSGSINKATTFQPSTGIISANCDRNVKVLVNKYQATTTTTTTTAETTLTATNVNAFSTIMNNSSNVSFKARPRSYYENTQTHKLIGKIHEYNDSRPPPAPTKVHVNTTINDSILMATQNHHNQQQRQRQQHGKTHPLARLSLPKQSFNAAAYNTIVCPQISLGFNLIQSQKQQFQQCKSKHMIITKIKIMKKSE